MAARPLPAMTVEDHQLVIAWNTPPEQETPLVLIVSSVTTRTHLASALSALASMLLSDDFDVSSGDISGDLAEVIVPVAPEPAPDAHLEAQYDDAQGQAGDE